MFFHPTYLLFASLSLYLQEIQAHPTGSKQNSSDDGALNGVDLLERAIDAIGGMDVLHRVKGLTYHAPNVYRSRTLTQNYNLKHSDQSVSSSGSQNISFNFETGHLQQRVNRFYRYSEYWIWAFPNLEPPINYSMVLQDGSDSWACFTEGQNSFVSEDPAVALGYADSYLADYLILTAQKFALPNLLTQFKNDSESLSGLVIRDIITDSTFPAIEDSNIGITLILNTTSYLPYKIRTYENHAIFGNVTSDLLLSSYSAVDVGDGQQIALPHRFQTVYSSTEVLEDFLVESITVNPTFEQGYFDVPKALETSSPKANPERSEEYPIAEVHEFFEAGLWPGPFNFNISDVVASQPLHGFPQIQTVYVGYPDYVQMVVEFEDGVLITDAPPHRSKILLQWVAETVGKPVKYIAPSHHHHDHAYGIGDYVKAGATIVVPEVAVEFYSKINSGNVSLATFDETHPFILKDSRVQFRAFWHDEAPHARDWTYSLATKACPSDDDQVVVFNADVWSPGSDGLRWDTGNARQWLDSAVVDELPRGSLVVGAHGFTRNGTSTLDVLERVIEITGYAYPDIKAGNLGDAC